MSGLDIVIVNWNTGTYLEKCVTSLKTVHAADPALIQSVTVVDNASTDGSLNFDGVAGLPLRTIRNTSNRGFGAACNQGVRGGVAQHILFLNPDAAVSVETLRITLHVMRDPQNQNVGICGVKLVGDDGRVATSCSRFPSLPVYLSDSLGLAYFWPRYFKPQAMSEWPHDETRYVDQIMGAYFCIRRSLFDQLGGFDERFYVYSEEVDLSYRAHLLGFASIFVADAAAYHKGGGSSEKVKAKRLFYYLRSRILYAFKHFNPVSAFIFAIITLCVEPLSRLTYALARRSPTAIAETLKGYAYLWAWVPLYVLFGKTQ